MEGLRQGSKYGLVHGIRRGRCVIFLLPEAGPRALAEFQVKRLSCENRLKRLQNIYKLKTKRYFTAFDRTDTLVCMLVILLK
jgi:hypothetical protein